MSTFLNAACIQMNSGPVIADNLKQAEKLIRQAAEAGAQLIVTPENTDFMRGDVRQKVAEAYTEEAHRGLPLFKTLAQDLGVWLVIGTLAVKEKEGDDKIAARSYLINDKGAIVAHYDKMHLFDVDLPNGESHRESDILAGGSQAIIAPTPWTGLGMSVCYDVRFAYLFRALAQGGAGILTLPAAFTVPTGRAHWEVLLRARAIETGSYVLAADQCGHHDGRKATYGHSMIVNPWGEIIAQAGEDVGFIRADLDLAAIEAARHAIPALKHDREFDLALAHQ